MPVTSSLWRLALLKFADPSSRRYRMDPCPHYSTNLSFPHLFSGSPSISTWDPQLLLPVHWSSRQPFMTGFLGLCLPPWSEPQFPHLGNGFSDDPVNFCWVPSGPVFSLGVWRYLQRTPAHLCSTVPPTGLPGAPAASVFRAGQWVHGPQRLLISGLSRPAG